MPLICLSTFCFTIAPAQSLMEAYGPDHTFNVTHRIESLSFGAQYPGLVRPKAQHWERHQMPSRITLPTPSGQRMRACACSPFHVFAFFCPCPSVSR